MHKVGSLRYRWRTQGDDKVRSSHAANDGLIFEWDNPPATGHPGADFGCRCWAETIFEDGLQVSDGDQELQDETHNLYHEYNPADDRLYMAGYYLYKPTLEIVFDKYKKQVEEAAIELNKDGTYRDLDPNLIKAVIANEMITRAGGAGAEAIVSYLFSDYGTYGPAQLGPEPRLAAGLSIQDAMTYEGAIEGAANWLDKQRRELISEGIVNPTNAQIASRYNQGRIASGEVNNYGRRVQFLIDRFFDER